MHRGAQRPRLQTDTHEIKAGPDSQAPIVSGSKVHQGRFEQRVRELVEGDEILEQAVAS